MTALGLARWGLSPDAFWRLTPREIAAALRGLGPPAVAAPARDDLARLLALHPDD